MEIKYLGAKEKRLHSIARQIGFTAAFLAFISMLFFILGRANKLPEYIRYWHAMAAVVIISLLAFVIKGIKNE